MKTTLSWLLCGCLLLLAWPAAAQSSFPLLTVWGDPGYGNWTFSGSDTPPVALTVNAGDPTGIGFHWSTDDSLGVDYRMGWDVADPDDPDDPGWLIPDYGDDTSVAPRVFDTGSHSFVVEARGAGGAVTRAVFAIDVVPVATRPLSWGAMKALFGG